MTLTEARSSGPLEGVVILDLTRVLSGPYATMLLGDLGATVIKVEDPRTGDTTRHSAPFQAGASHYFLTLNRNKKSLALDIKTPRGLEIVKSLCRRADVLVENFRPGKLAQLGLDAETLRATNPALIVCSISGFGQNGPLRDRIAYDVIAQAMSGVLSTNGEPDGPPVRLSLPVADCAAGLFADIGILAALLARDRGREVRSIDIGLFDGLISMLGYMTTLYSMNGQTAPRVGSRHQSVVPYGTFATNDGWLALAVFSSKFWMKFCKAVEREDLASDERFKRTRDRMQNRGALEAEIEAIMLTRSTAQWDEMLQRADVPASAILTVPQALDHPQTAARGMFPEISHPAYGTFRVAGPPLKMGGKNVDHPTAPPLLGEDTADVLRVFAQLSDDEIAALVRDGVATVAERPAVQAESNA